MTDGNKGTHRERPIPFSGEMVRAVLDGRKTQTRRLVDFSRAKCAADCSGPKIDEAWVDPGGTDVFGPGPYLKVPCAEGAAQRVYPKYEVGDRLWVRERIDQRRSPGEHGPHAYYAADSTRVEELGRRWPWKRSFIPPMFCPRDCSRITLEVTSVRVERLHAITEEDAIAEGTGDYGIGYMRALLAMGEKRYHFATLWDSINGKRADWMSNPWVWVYGFKRVEEVARAA